MSRPTAFVMINAEIGEEEEVQVITETSFVWIPIGMEHGPLNIKTVNKPIMFMDIVMSSSQPGAGQKYSPKNE